MYKMDLYYIYISFIASVCTFMLKSKRFSFIYKRMYDLTLFLLGSSYHFTGKLCEWIFLGYSDIYPNKKTFFIFNKPITMRDSLNTILNLN